MKPSEAITLDKIIETSQPQLIVELLNVGFPSEKISDAILALRDAIAFVFRCGLKSNHIQELILVLNGVSHNSTWLKKIETEFTNSLTLSLGVDPDMAFRISQKLIPFAIQATGNHLSASHLNRIGISNLVSFTPTRQGNLFELTGNQLLKLVTVIVMLLIH